MKNVNWKNGKSQEKVKKRKSQALILGEFFLGHYAAPTSSSCPSAKNPLGEKSGSGVICSKKLSANQIAEFFKLEYLWNCMT